MTDIQIPTKLSGFTPILDSMTARYGLVGAAVFGVVWRHANMRNGVCSASQERMAELLGVNRMTINRWISKLCEDGYLEDTTPDTKNRAHVYRVTGKAGLAQTIEAFDGGDTQSSSNGLGATLNSTTATLSSTTATLSSTTATQSSTSRQLREELREEAGKAATAASDASLLDRLTGEYIQWANAKGKQRNSQGAEKAVRDWVTHVHSKGKGWRLNNFQAIDDNYEKAIIAAEAGEPEPKQPIAWEVAG